MDSIYGTESDILDGFGSLEMRQSSIWYPGSLGQSSHWPSVWWSKYYFDRLKILQWIAGLDLRTVFVKILKLLSLSLSLSADLCIHSYWLSWLRQASHRKMIQSSALRLRRFKILKCPLLKCLAEKELCLSNIVLPGSVLLEQLERC